MVVIVKYGAKQEPKNMYVRDETIACTANQMEMDGKR